MTDTPETDQPWLTALLRLASHLPIANPDVSLLVLKGHLLTEEILRDFIATKMTTPRHLRKARLKYDQCIHLARSLSDRPDSWVWPALALLNTVRNKFSHELEPQKVATTITEFIRLVEREVQPELSAQTRDVYEELNNPLAVAILCLHTKLSVELTYVPHLLRELASPAHESGGG